MNRYDLYFDRNPDFSLSRHNPDLTFKETPLFPAVRNNNPREIRRLIEEENLDVNAVDTCGRNALNAALAMGALKPDACKTLIEMGINIEHKGCKCIARPFWKQR